MISGTVSWESPANIALIKYWGKRSGQLPNNASLSFTLSRSVTQTSVQYKHTGYHGDIRMKFDFADSDYRRLFSERIINYINTIRKYRRFVFSCSESAFQFIPEGCIKGFKRFCDEVKIPFEIVRKLDLSNVQPGSIYLLYSDMELISLIKEVESWNWMPGKDVGIISYDETPMKEILKGGISVLSTDFRQMGITVASFINGESFIQQPNIFRFILRNSI